MAAEYDIRERKDARGVPVFDVFHRERYFFGLLSRWRPIAINFASYEEARQWLYGYYIGKER